MNMIWNSLNNRNHREQLFILINMLVFALFGTVPAFFIRLIFPDLLNLVMIYFICIGYSSILPGFLGGLLFLYRKSDE